RTPAADSPPFARRPSASVSPLLRNPRALPRSLSFAHDFISLLVGPKTEIDGLTHFAFARPLREFHLGHQTRLDPRRHAFVLYPGGEGRFWSSQPHELGMQLFQRLVSETGP